MIFVDRNSVFNKIMNDEPISNIWVFNPKDIKGTSKQIEDGRGYLTMTQVSSGMTIDDIRKEGLIFIEFTSEKEELSNE